MDNIKERMLSDFNLNKSEVVESPRQKAHKDMVNDPNKLGHFIAYTMNRLIQAKKGFTWDDYCSTAEWAVIAMNLSEDDKYKFGSKWKEIYDMLLTPDANEVTENAKEKNKEEVERHARLYKEGNPEVSPEEFNKLKEDSSGDDS